jgi:hypothetical protein
MTGSFPPIEPDRVSDEGSRLKATVSRIAQLRRRRRALGAVAAAAVALAVLLPITLSSGSGRPRSVQVVGQPTTTALPATTALPPFTPTSTSVTPRTAAPTTPATSAVSSTSSLGTSTPHCRGCGQSKPGHFAIEPFEVGNQVFPGMTFTNLNWQDWGNRQATAETTALFGGPGEYGKVTVVAFDLGECDGVPAYQAVEWPGTLQAFDPSSYFNLCTGQGIGTGWPAAMPQPTLGLPGARFGGVGFGQVQPSRVYFGGDSSA